MPPVQTGPKPFWETADHRTVRLYHGHVTDVLARLPEKSVHCIVTSPPYWGLRDYGVEGQLGAEPSPDCGTQGQAQCGRCFVCAMVAVFRGVRRVLRDDGVCWINLGDSYASGEVGRNDDDARNLERRAAKFGTGRRKDGREHDRQTRKMLMGLPSGNLVGVPWRVALALQADGWVLRQDVIWHKPAPMPESVRNRCTKAHEYVFLLTKGTRYFYDAESIKQKSAGGNVFNKPTGAYPGRGDVDSVGITIPATDSNKRSVWTVSSQGYPGAHFATFPPKLIEPMIKAGTSERGCCAGCKAPWRRLVEERALTRDRPNDYVKRTGEEGTGNSCPNSVAGVEARTVGWEPTCECNGRRVKAYEVVDGRRVATTLYDSDLPLEEHPVIPCTVLDPFVGAGTTCAVSLLLGRRSVGIDLSEKYLRENAMPRVRDVITARSSLGHLNPNRVDWVRAGLEVAGRGEDA